MRIPNENMKFFWDFRTVQTSTNQYKPEEKIIFKNLIPLYMQIDFPNAV